MGNYSLPHFVNEFYKKSFFEHSLFGFVTALKLEGNLTTKEAVRRYLDFMNIDEDEAAFRSVYYRYYKLLASYRKIKGVERLKLNDLIDEEETKASQKIHESSR